jgi:putative ABC transport system substrate-binding protein
VIDRRTFVGALVGSLVATLHDAAAQPQDKVWRIGYLGGSEQAAPLMQFFRDGMRDRGYIEGRDYVLEIRHARGDPDRAAALAAELVGLKLDIFMAGTQESIRAARNATTTIPIVMSLATDPVGSGLVASLAHPGGNVTGTTGTVSPDFYGKCLENLRVAVPTASRVSVLANVTLFEFNSDSARRVAIEEAARKLGMKLRIVGIREPRDVASALSGFTPGTSDAVLVVSSPTLYGQRIAIIESLARLRLPAVYDDRTWVEAGGLMSYGASWRDLIRRSAYYVDRIIKGAKSADLPVEQPTKFELVINMKTAKALGLTIPQSLLLRADEVIQ